MTLKLERNRMQKSGSHQAPKATTPQLTTWLPLLPPGIQTDEIECHRTGHLLQMHGWLASTAGLSASHPTNRLRNTGFDSTAQAIVALIGFIGRLRSIARQQLRTLSWRQAQFAPVFERSGAQCSDRAGLTGSRAKSTVMLPACLPRRATCHDWLACPCGQRTLCCCQSTSNSLSV